jgi:carbon-monoxide dehydrogenase medium subunit/6-hydroxypseudooxynicotine dehydrogenase subunit alpha
VKLPPFAYRRADSPEHALELLAEGGAEAKLLGGGQSLLPLMAFRMASPAELIDVGSLDELRYIRYENRSLIVGATTRHAALEEATLPRGWEAFTDALPLIGHLPIRSRGTIGGSIAHADSTAELPLLAQTFDATVVVRSCGASREIPAESFFRGILTTDLQPTEMVSEVRFAGAPPGAASAFEEFSERAGDFALASACVALAVDDSGVCTWSRVGLGAVASRPVRSAAAEAALVGARLDSATVDAASSAVLQDCHPREGLHCSVEFRRELIVTMTRRALRRATRRLMPDS